MGDVVKQPAITKDNNPISLQVPLLKPTNYTMWAMNMKVILSVNRVWEMIEPETTIDARKDNIATALIFQAIPEELVLQIGNLNSAKEMWDAVKVRHQGAERVKEARLQMLTSEFENLRMNENGR